MNTAPGTKVGADSGEGDVQAFALTASSEGELSNTLAPAHDQGLPDLERERLELERARLELERAQLERSRRELEAAAPAASEPREKRAPARRARVSDRLAPQRRGGHPALWVGLGAVVVASGGVAYHFLRPRSPLEKVAAALDEAVTQASEQQVAEVEAVRLQPKDYVADTIRLFQEIRRRTVMADLAATGNRADGERELRDRAAKVEIALADLMDVLPRIPRSVDETGRANLRVAELRTLYPEWSLMVQASSSGDALVLDEMTNRFRRRLEAISGHVQRVAKAHAKRETDRALGR